MTGGAARAVFLDRDGVINALVHYEDTGEYESPRTPADFDLLPDVIPALQSLQKAGWSLLLVSNQPSYAKGKTTLENLNAVHDLLHAYLQQQAVGFTQYYYSYHHPAAIVPELRGESGFRKPNPGFLRLAERQYRLDLHASWMVGDRDSDVLCGQRAGCRTAQINYQYSEANRGDSSPDIVCGSLREFVEQIGSGRLTSTKIEPAPV